MSLYRRILSLVKSFFVSSSIRKTIQTSHIFIIAVMVIPVFVSIISSMFHTMTYDRLISNVNRINLVNQVVKADITNELWDIVAGNKSFDLGRQYEIIDSVNHEISNIMMTTTANENRQLLEVASRAMNTLTGYVDRIGMQMEERYPVIENEQILDEIRGVSVLVSEILQNFIVVEIESAAQENEVIKRRTLIVGILDLVMFALVMTFSVIIQISVSSNIARSIGGLVALSSRIADGDLDARVEVYPENELHSLAEDLNTMAGKIKELVETNTREQQNLQKSEMKALQAQITPHFLYNTLDTIIWLAEGKQYDQVVSITRAFSDFFRISLNRGKEWVSVEDEFHHVESYLTIQKIRYRDILDYSISYEKNMGEHTILKLLLQPLVENALYHGIKNKRGKGMIEIKGWSECGFLCFMIKDNGIGMTQERLQDVREQIARPPDSESMNSIYGLYNVSKRLELYYDAPGLLELQSVYNEGTSVFVKVPEV
jgi:two-component system sensor histidine kinase YesM